MSNFNRKHYEVFDDVEVLYDKETQYLYIIDKDSDEQLAIFHVMEED